VGFCDASGLAVLVNTGRRARLLGGFLRLASVSPQAGRVLAITGLRRHLAIFPIVQAAATGAQAAQGGTAAAAVRGRAARAHRGPAHGPTGPSPVLVDAGDLRAAVAALLACADAWHDADPRRRFTPALRAMARAREGTDDTALDRAARSLLAALAAIPSPPHPRSPPPPPACGGPSIPPPGSPQPDGGRPTSHGSGGRTPCLGMPSREAGTDPPGTG
jgi:hypothetical protein